MKASFIFILTILSAGSASSQEVRLNTYGSYVFDDKVESYYSTTDYFHGTIKGGFLWGSGLEFRMHNSYGIEILYQRQNTHAPVYYYDVYGLGEKTTNLDLSINWIMAGGMRAVKVNDKVEPYGGLLLGAAIIDAHNTESGGNSGSATKFAWGLKAGCNIWANPRFGIKLQAQLLSAVQAAGGSIYFFGTNGSGGAVSAYSTMFQFSLGGGLVFVLSKK